MGERIATLRKERSMTQPMLASKMNVSQSTVTSWENDRRGIGNDDLVKLATLFNVSTDYLLGKTNKRHYYSLTKKDYKDVDQMLEDAMAGVTGKAGVNYFKNGSELTETDRELLEASLRQTMILSKVLAKKKFTPKKYRGSETDDHAE
jgi:transcriptional regulator with XRE-family HTH domain